jgi:endonuclease/exonuclease/phosphatase family metal-dependent hydrolase
MKRARSAQPGERGTGEVPLRVSVMTWNIWKQKGCDLHDWERRCPVMKSVVATFSPDVLALQEACPESISAILEALPHHQMVAGGDEKDEEAWRVEGNILYDARMFKCTSFGAEEVGMESGRAEELTCSWPS